MCGTDILNIGGQPSHDNNIIKQQYHGYSPYTTSFENNDEIRISIQSQDLYVLPSESYIYFEVQVTRKTGATHSAVQGTWNCNYAASFFSEIRYELNGTEIDRTKNVGLTSLIKLCSALHESDVQMNNIISYYMDKNLEARTYPFIIPLRSVLGFCDDYRKIIMNAKHELILVRSRKDIQSFMAATESFNLKVTKILWKVPHVTLADHSKLTMLRYLEKKQTLTVPFRSWDLYEMPQLPQSTRHIWTVKSTAQVNKPRFVFVVFQTDRQRITVNSLSFDHCDISDVKLFLNSEYYPYDNFNSNFGNSNCHELHLAYLKIQQSYYNSQSNNPFSQSYDSFREHPVFAFDCTRSDESVFGGTVDVRLEINARNNIPANTAAYCLIIYDNQIEYSPFSGIVVRNN